MRAARKWLEAAESGIESGTITQGLLIQASRGVREAERDAAETRDEEITAIEAHMNRMTRSVEWIANNFGLHNEHSNGLSDREARAEQTATAVMLAGARRGKLPGR